MNAGRRGGKKRGIGVMDGVPGSDRENPAGLKLFRFSGLGRHRDIGGHEGSMTRDAWFVTRHANAQQTARLTKQCPPAYRR